MVNKKGYLRTIEAIVAILLVFGFLLTVLSQGDVTEKDSHEEPVALALTGDALLAEMQKNDVFRACILNNEQSTVTAIADIEETGIDISNQDGLDGASSLDCVYSFLDGNLPEYSPWNFAFSICSTVDDDCLYYPLLTEDEEVVYSVNQVLPVQADIYPKAIFLSIPDIVANPVTVEYLDIYDQLDVEDTEFDEDDLSEAFVNTLDEQQGIGSEYKVVTVYFWDAE